jgi:type I restriction enzyme M protein
MARGRSKAAEKSSKKSKNGDGGNLGFEAELFKAADKLRGNMEPSDYKHVALGLIFLKHISDSFEARRAALLEDDKTFPKNAGTKPSEDPDEYAAENVFWVPKEARGRTCRPTPSNRRSAS